MERCHFKGWRWSCLPPLSESGFLPPYRSTGHIPACRTNDDMRFADYRNGLGGLTVSTNCLSALGNTLEVLNIKELKTRSLT